MCSGIPEGTYELKIGASFLCSNKSRPPEFNTLRFDFKPASISSEASEAYVVQSQNQNENNFQVVVFGEAQKKTIFKGAKKEIKGDKECLLVYNRKSKELCLERVSANINVKKTRDTDLDQKAISEIERLQKRRRPKQSPPSPKAPVENATAVEPPAEQRKERTFSTSSAGDEIDEDDEENVSALEQLMAPTKVERSEAEEDIFHPAQQRPKMELKTEEHQNQMEESANGTTEREEKQSPQQKHPMAVKKTSSFVRKSILAEDLQLSESSSEDEEDGGRDSEDTD
ncbi:hypothetical protein niasHS_017027 [Heterodera schachtii]|uniref:Ell-associated factor Eaf n=1 Tax=Heterodera schachtii TaxID=97005 RepID=A0ABD2HW87_HETSC